MSLQLWVTQFRKGLVELCVMAGNDLDQQFVARCARRAWWLASGTRSKSE